MWEVRSEEAGIKFREITEKLEVGWGGIDEEIGSNDKKDQGGNYKEKEEERRKWEEEMMGWGMQKEEERSGKDFKRVEEGRVGKEEYIKRKKEYRSLCKRKKRREIKS